ncbi:YjjG family noncanonical pyrimidine nucleotidase [Patiriisocius marinus]|uniref:Noncanonical pyrimidine nucleotidase, YjjG family protein n=1 Tax=Patiriisocius marinus TaxID=1397112 RepID=A0A5J4J0C9_9FLAO|nr:YjjG family noncanonical pyrimidine nucleotidase [Patiriisocius marinus]GER60736.1 noncanonical pyrimidine nucleotidase, YjjG family protein [Patiriisocius marinus]
MNNIKITDVFFDLDHTLWDFDRNSALAFKLVFQKHNVQIDLQDFLKIYEPINFNYWKAFREERVTKQQLRRGRLADSFTALKHTISVQIIDEMSDSYIEFLPENNYLLDGTIEILDYLKPKYNLHIITNGFTDVQGIKMKRSGLSPYFKTITSSEEVGVKKPNPLVFHHALKKGNTLAESSAMIGDTFEADILGAEAVGMDTIFYNYHKDVQRSGYKVVERLLEIKGLL